MVEKIPDRDRLQTGKEYRLSLNFPPMDFQAVYLGRKDDGFYFEEESQYIFMRGDQLTLNLERDRVTTTCWFRRNKDEETEKRVSEGDLGAISRDFMIPIGLPLS